MSTDPVSIERRSGQRFQLHLPVTFHVDGKAVPGFTQDVSSRGLFLYTEAQLAEGSVVELTFTMPSEITLGESMRVRGRGRVLRADHSNSGPRTGVAVQLDSYQYLPALDGAPSADLVRVSVADPDGERSGAFSR
ncbi:MAG: PilZ domain-containing protein [Acidobacteria bacterium]|nr:PilZ domain-containing protein [Acidobacteriota bacterium]